MTVPPRLANANLEPVSLCRLFTNIFSNLVEVEVFHTVIIEVSGKVISARQ